MISSLLFCDRCLGPMSGGAQTPHGLLCYKCREVMKYCICEFVDGERLPDAMCRVVHNPVVRPTVVGRRRG